MSDNSTIEKVFGDEAAASEDYAKRFEGPVGAYFLEVQAEIIRELTSPWKTGTVLDVGGGHGQVARALIDSGRHVTVASTLPADQTQVATLVQDGKISFRQCDLSRLPFAAHSFDVVIALRMLAHVDDWRAFLAEIARVARHAVIVDFAEKRSAQALSGSLFKLKKAIEKNTRPFRMLHRGEVISALQDNGLDRAVARPQFVAPMALHRAIGNARWSRATESRLAAVGLKRFGTPVILSMTRMLDDPGPDLGPMPSEHLRRS